MGRTGGQLELFSMAKMYRDQLKSTDIRFVIFSQLQYVGPPIACFEISLSWLEPWYSCGVRAWFSAH